MRVGYKQAGLWTLAVLRLAPALLASPLPMTDYSQLNHDEPTHWTKPATTPTEEQALEVEPGTTEKVGDDGIQTNILLSATKRGDGDSQNISKDVPSLEFTTLESETTAGDDLVAVGAVESLDKDGSAISVGGIAPLGDEGFLPLAKDEITESLNTRSSRNKNDSGGNTKNYEAAVIVDAPTASIGTIKTEPGVNALFLSTRDRLPPAYGTPRLEATENMSMQDPIDKLARKRDELEGDIGVAEFQENFDNQQVPINDLSRSRDVSGTSTTNSSVHFESQPQATLAYKTIDDKNKKEIEPTSLNMNLIDVSQLDTKNIRKINGTVQDLKYSETKTSLPVTSFETQTTGGSKTSAVSSIINNTDFFKDQNTDFTSEIASIEAKDDNLINDIRRSDKDDLSRKDNEATTKMTVDDSNNTEQFFRYDIIEDIRNLFSNDNEVSENDVKENQLEDVLGFKGEDKVPTEDTLIVQRIEDGGYEAGYQEEEQPNKEEKKVIDSLVVPTVGEKETNYETPFSDWDRESEEQEHNMENIVFQMGNESEMAAMDSTNKGNLDGGCWFLLLLSGNSTIVQKRQKDFAKYLKLNLAARLSLEYDELRVNKVVLAPPRLMVNVSVVPSENDNFDEEFDLNERLFGEEEAPLHKLAETNATLLELSGEEYHVVRFLSLRSAQPMTMEEKAVQESRQVSDKHSDIESLIYIVVGGPCLTLIVFLVYTLYRLYLLPKNDWPWQRDKPIFSTGPRHQRMSDSNPFTKPLTVIYSGSFVDRNGPPSGSWLDENYRPEAHEKVEPSIENPSYGLGSLSKNALSEICEPSVLDSPRFNVRMMGCQPAHLLLPRTPVKKISDIRPPKCPPKGLDNPNYLT